MKLQIVEYTNSNNAERKATTFKGAHFSSPASVSDKEFTEALLSGKFSDSGLTNDSGMKVFTYGGNSSRRAVEVDDKLISKGIDVIRQADLIEIKINLKDLD